MNEPISKKLVIQGPRISLPRVVEIAVLLAMIVVLIRFHGSSDRVDGLIVTADKLQIRECNFQNSRYRTTRDRLVALVAVDDVQYSAQVAIVTAMRQAHDHWLARHDTTTAAYWTILAAQQRVLANVSASQAKVDRLGITNLDALYKSAPSCPTLNKDVMVYPTPR